MQDKSSTLTPEILEIIQNKGTEAPGTGKYCTVKQNGTYLCRRCGLGLFSSNNKFESGTGWPSFDAADAKNVTQVPDIDGRRTEIICSRCHGHLGHVFKGEGLTKKNERYCVNSLALDLVSKTDVVDTNEAILAGGCFWGVEALMSKQPGVLKVESGYTGGKTTNPTYKQICTGKTGHLEAVRVVFDPAKNNFENLAKYFMEIHDPTQNNGQGPDIGPQYHSAIFYLDEEQKKIAKKTIKILEDKGLVIATKILPATIFWAAEEYHQGYYEKNGSDPYCHFYTKRF